MADLIIGYIFYFLLLWNANLIRNHASLGQNFVGTALKQCDDDDEEDDDDEMYDSNTVFGIISAINIVHKRDKNCVKQLYDFLMEKVKPSDAATIKVFKDKLNDATKEVGFLLNERFVNIPPEISVPMLENLEKEIQRAKNKKMHFNFAYYLMIIKYYEKPADGANALEIIYSNSEEEVFCKEAIASFDYSVEIESDSGMAGKWKEDDPILKPMRKVILFEANKLPSIITTIKEFISEWND